jgi:cytochrome c peroxidase
VTKQDKDRGAFKTPTLREVGLHPPFMHDGSIKTLREVVELYNRGGVANPYLDPKMKPLKLTPGEIDALVQLMEALRGEGYRDTAPAAFPGQRARTTS